MALFGEKEGLRQASLIPGMFQMHPGVVTLVNKQNGNEKRNGPPYLSSKCSDLLGLRSEQRSPLEHGI